MFRLANVSSSVLVTVFLCLPPLPVQIWHFLSFDFAFGSCTSWAVHVAAFVRACMDFPVTARKLHCKLDVVNDNQTVILLLSLLSFLCLDSRPFWHSSSPPNARGQSSSFCRMNNYTADHCTTYLQNHPSPASQPASQSKNRLWKWHGYFSRAQAYLGIGSPTWP